MTDQELETARAEWARLSDFEKDELRQTAEHHQYTVAELVHGGWRWTLAGGGRWYLGHGATCHTLFPALAEGTTLDQ